MEAVLVLLAAWPKKQITEKGHSQPAAPKRWRGDLLGRGKALWNWQKRQPQPLTETTCSAAKRIWNSKALPVFILLLGLQLVVRDRVLPFGPLRRAGCFIQKGSGCSDQYNHQDVCYAAGKNPSARESRLLMVQQKWFSSFLQTTANKFFTVDTRKRECLDNLLSLKNPDVAK